MDFLVAVSLSVNLAIMDLSVDLALAVDMTVSADLTVTVDL